MILERAIIAVRPGEEAAFEAVFPEARSVILAAEGCRSARLLRGVESPASYLLLVEWDALEDHMERFRGSPLFARWRELIGPYFDQPPLVEHYRPLA